MENMYPIGVASKMVGISVESIRYYQKEGLVTPNYIDSKTNYRYFDEKNLEELFNIVFLRDSGFSIAEIKGFSNIDNKEKLSIINAKIKYLEEEIYKEKMLVKRLKKKEAGMKLLHSNEYVYEVIIKKFSSRYGNFSLETENSTILQHNEIISKLESSLSYVDKLDFSPARITYRKGDNYYLKGLMCVLSNNRLYSKEFMDKNIENMAYSEKIDNEIRRKILPAGKYLTLIVKGVESKNNAYIELINYALKNNIELDDTAIELLILNCDFLINKDNTLREIQIRIVN